VKSKGIRGTVGAVIPYNESVCALTAGHVIRYGNGAVGTKVVVDGHDSTVVQLLNDYDLALIDVPPEHATLSVIGCARFGPAELGVPVSGQRSLSRMIGTSTAELSTPGETSTGSHFRARTCRCQETAVRRSCRRARSSGCFHQSCTTTVRVSAYPPRSSAIHRV